MIKTPYVLCSDYDLLWNLIYMGYHIPCWVNGSISKRELKEVSLLGGGKYFIGNKSPLQRNYSAFTQEEFINDCKKINLGYIAPDEGFWKDEDEPV